MAATQTDNLQVPLIDPFQSRKDITANEGTSALELALSATYTVNAGVEASPFTLPYAATAGGEKTALRFVRLAVTGSPASAYTIIHPNQRHLFFVANGTGQPVTVKTAGAAGTTVPAGTTLLAYCDGTNVEAVSVGGAVALATFLDLSDTPGTYGSAHQRLKVNAAGTALEWADQPYDLKLFVPGGPLESGALLLRDVAARAYQLPNGLTGSQSYLGTPPTASGALSIRKNGAEIISATYSAAGTSLGFTTTVVGPYDFAAGDRLEVFASGTVDATLGNISLSLKAALKE